MTVREIQSHAILVLADAFRTHDGAQLAEVPAQLGARIGGRVPEELAQLLSRRGARRQRKIGQQCAYLAGCG
jgi:hypothetical protein